MWWSLGYCEQVETSKTVVHRMTVSYEPAGEVKFDEIFDGRMVKSGINEHVDAETSETDRCLTDGHNFLWVYRREDGTVSASRFGRNDADFILAALETEFEVAWTSDDD